MRSSRFLIVALVAALAMLQGCATSKSGSVYSRDDARREQSVRMGVLESVRSVSIEGTKSPVGAGAGAVAGGVGGSMIGSGRGSAVAAVAGAVVGGLIGAAAEEGLTRRQGVELTVRLDNGEMVAIVQEADETFKPGERVRLLSVNGQTRVSR
jgi:outer membrane lipoprotein SlyB